MEGLSTLFKQRKNPYMAQAQTTAGIFEHSGFAKPFLAAALGADMAKAAQWDEMAAQREHNLAASKADMEFFLSSMKNILEMSKEDKNAANKWLDNLRATGNPFARHLEGVYFADKTTKDGYLTLDRGDKLSVVHISAFGRKGELIKSGLSEEQAQVELSNEGLWQDFSKQKDEPKGDFSLFYRAKKAEGWGDDQISAEWEKRKIRVARESRPSLEEGQPNNIILTHPGTQHSIVVNKKDAKAVQQALDEGYKPQTQSIMEELVNQALRQRINKSREQGSQSTITPPSKTTGQRFEGQPRDITPILNYLNKNASAKSQSEMLRELKAEGYTDKEVVRAWNIYRSK